MKRIFIIIILIILGASRVLASDTLEVYLVKVLKYRENQFAYYICNFNQETNNYTKTGNYNDLMTIKSNIKKLIYHNPLIINNSKTQHITERFKIDSENYCPCLYNFSDFIYNEDLSKDSNQYLICVQKIKLIVYQERISFSIRGKSYISIIGKENLLSIKDSKLFDPFKLFGLTFRKKLIVASHPIY